MKTKILKTGPVERRDLILNGNIVKTLDAVNANFDDECCPVPHAVV